MTENEVATFRKQTMVGTRFVKGIKRFNRREGRLIENPNFKWCEQHCQKIKSRIIREDMKKQEGE
jgi:hypothetical protein